MSQTMPPEAAAMPTQFVLQLGMITRQYVLLRTNAPQRYDYGYVLTLLEDDGTRWILVPLESVAYQTGRYHSGLYWTVASADFDRDDIAERIMGAINARFTDPNAE